jgi:hypothetical protein
LVEFEVVDVEPTVKTNTENWAGFGKVWSSFASGKAVLKRTDFGPILDRFLDELWAHFAIRHL